MSVPSDLAVDWWPVVLGFFLSIQFDILSIPVAAGAAILFGFLAVAFGDRFWYGLMKFGSWFGW